MESDLPSGLRCVIERTLEPPDISSDTTPIIYLPGVGRQELGAAEACADHLKPLVELQYRGVCWTQKNGKGLDSGSVSGFRARRALVWTSRVTRPLDMPFNAR